MKYRILVVDDDKDILEVYSRALELNGFEVVCAKDGADGLDALKVSKFDLIVLDLVMPKMSGDEFLRIIRNDPKLKDMKVLVSSSRVYNYKPKYPKGLADRIFDTFSGTHKKDEELVQTGRTDVSKKAEEIGAANVTPDKLKIDEKTRQHITPVTIGVNVLEDEPKFRRRIGVALVENVREMLSIKHVKGIIDLKPDQ